MARLTPIKVLRATRSALNAQASALGLMAGEPYLITDEGRFAIGTSTGQYQAVALQSEMPIRGFRNGLTIANSATDPTNSILVASGQISSDSTIPQVITLASTLSKRLDAAWAVGNGNGAWLDGSSMPDGTGHVFAISRSDTGVTDVACSASMSPTLPSGYDSKKRIGSVVRESGAIVQFQQINNLFLRAPKVQRDSASAVSSGALTLSIPSGLPLIALLSSELDVAPSSDVSNLIGTGPSGVASFAFQRVKTGDLAGNLDVSQIDWVVTNSSAQVYFAAAIASGNIRSNKLTTLGWFEISDITQGASTSVAAATTVIAGVAKKATQGETDAGTANSGFVSPETLAAWSGRSFKVGADIGDGSAVQFTITHNFGTRDVQVEVYRASGNFDTVLVEVERTSVNTVRLTFASAPALNEFRAVVMA